MRALLTMLALAFALAATPAVLAAPGQTVRSPVPLGPLKVPLPPGDWIIVAENEGFTSGSNARGAPWRGLYLVQLTEDRRFAAGVYLRTTLSSNQGQNWTDTICERADTLHRNLLKSTFTHPECIVVNHYVRFFQDAQPDDFNRSIREWLLQEKVQLPNATLAVLTRFYRFGDYLWANFWVNPDLAGLPPSSNNGWMASEWHVQRIKESPDRLAYVERFKAWGETIGPLERDVLHQRNPVAELPAWPR